MSGYGEYARELEYSRWVAKWAPLDEMPAEIDPGQYRHILATKREVEHKYKELLASVDCLRKLVNG